MITDTELFDITTLKLRPRTTRGKVTCNICGYWIWTEDPMGTFNYGLVRKFSKEHGSLGDKHGIWDSILRALGIRKGIAY